MIPGKFAPILFSAILSGIMSLVVSAISTFAALGPGNEFLGSWMSAWLPAWLIAFPVVSFVAPLTRRLVNALTAERP